MTTADLVLIYKRNLLALSSHAMKVSMDDSEHISLIRVLVETAKTLREEIGVSESKIESIAWELTEYAKSLYNQVVSRGKSRNIGQKGFCRGVR